MELSVSDTFFLFAYNVSAEKYDEFVQDVTTTFLTILRANTPVRSGFMKSNYQVFGDIVVNDTDYFEFVNDGTIYQEAQHFLEDSIDETESMIDGIAEKYK